MFLCRLAEVPDGKAHLIDRGEAFEPRRVVLLRTGDRVLAYENRCPHFGVPLAQRNEQLIQVAHTSISCNTHYARFRWHDGYCEFGDCEGESLRALAVAVTGDEVHLLLSGA